MLKREYKYLVPNEKIDELRDAIRPFVNLDGYADITSKKEYTVRSIYLDNSSLKFYNEKLDGLQNRKKLRIRGYNEQGINSIIFLEIKRKFENNIYKNRTSGYFETLEDFLLNGNSEYFVVNANKDEIENANKFLFHYKIKMLKPVSLIVYDREAYFSKFDSNTRITFDKNLRYSSMPSFNLLYNEEILKLAMKNFFVLEIKFYRGYSQLLQKVLRQFNLARLAVSKYQICIDSDKFIAGPIQNKSFYFTSPATIEKIYSEEVFNYD